jgi:hypothetical protein
MLRIALALVFALSWTLALADPASAVSGLITRMLGPQFLPSFQFETIPPVGNLCVIVNSLFGGSSTVLQRRF